ERDRFQNRLNTSAKIEKSSTLVVRMLRKLRKTSSRSIVSITRNAAAAVTASAGVTCSPCALNSRQKPTSFSTSRLDIRRNPRQLGFERRHVTLVLEKTSERFRHDLFIQLRRLQSNERVGPVERFCDAGNLRQAHRSRRLHHSSDTRRQAFRDQRNFRAHDLEFFLERRIINPVIQTTASQRI